MWKLTFFTVFLFYPLVCSTIINTFNCVTVEGTSYLHSDFSVLCADKKHLHYALVMVILYAI